MTTFHTDRLNAEVIATFGRHLLLRDAAGDAARRGRMGRSLEIVCGDRVQCETDGAEAAGARPSCHAPRVLRRSIAARRAAKRWPPT